MKWIPQVLGLSLVLNGALFLLFFFFVIQNPLKEESFLFASHPTRKVIKENNPLAQQFSTCSFDELVSFLNSKELIEKTEKRKIALALLMKRHFAVKKIYPLFEGEEDELILYDLTDAQFRKIHHFAKTELFPLDTKGLFLKLKQEKEENLLLAFQATEEFMLIKHLFSTIGASDEVCIELLLEGKYLQIETFFEEQKQNLDLSKKRLFLFLQDAQTDGSKLAGLLLMRCFDTQKKSAQNEVAQKKSVQNEVLQRREYRVEPGDSLWKIAKKNQISIKQLEECNKLTSEHLKPGQILFLP